MNVLYAGPGVLASWEATALGWLFLPLAALALLVRPRWLMALVPVAAVMQAPAVGTVALGDSRFGVTPFNALCGLTGLHLVRLALGYASRSRQESWPAIPRLAGWTWVLWTAFLAVSIVGALVLPTLFAGTPVFPAFTRGISMPWTEPLHPSASNIAQALNCTALWVLLTWAMLLPARARVLQSFGFGLAVAFAITIIAGLHQRAAAAGWVPWLMEFWGSNPSYNQWFHAPEYGPAAMFRVGLPFIEPSYASVWFAAAFCGGLTWAIYSRRGQRVALGVTLLAGLGLASTLGSTGLLAVFAFLALLVPFHLLGGRRHSDPRALRALWVPLAVGGFTLGLLLIDWVWWRTEALTPLRDSVEWTWQKLATYVGSGRDLMNRQVGEVLMQTHGLGVGAGSSRASGYFHSLVANTGLVGAAFYFAALLVQWRGATRAIRVDRPLTLLLPAAAYAVLLGVAVGIPDQSWPVVWLAWLGLFLLALGGNETPPDEKRPLRVLLITQWFDPEPTFKGMAFARGLANRGHEVEVVTGFPNYPGGKFYPGYRLRWRQREAGEGVTLLRMPLYPSHDGSALGRIANYLTFAVSATVGGVLLARRPDVVYAYHPPLTTALAGSAVSFLKDVPLVIDIQDLWPDTLRATGMIRSPRVLALIDRVCRGSYASAAAIAVLSPGFRAALVARGVPPSKLQVIYNWADEQALGAAPGEAPSVMHGRFNVIFAGTMGKAQALDAVLDASRQVAIKAPHVQFVFVGGGVEVAHLQARVAQDNLSNVVFLPRMPMSEIGRVLHAADALLVHLKDDPLFAITVPAKTQAYMAVGRPIIMAVRGDAAALVERAGAGLVAEPQAPAALAAAVLTMAALPAGQREALGAAAADYYRRELSLAIGARHFEALFRRAIQNYAAPAHTEEKGHVENHV